MNRKLVFSIHLVFFVVLFAGMVAAAEMGDKCQLCGMNLSGNENTAYEITFTDGKVITYCCPHCGLYDHAKHQDKIASVRAKDFISGEWMEPKDMVFLFKSTAIPACSPSWIGFGKKEEAEKFQTGFGGTLYDFDKALEERAKMPASMMKM